MGRGWKVLGVLVFGAMLVPQVQGVRAASAAVVCRKRTGVLVQRERCKRGEASVDLSGLGAVGPQGPQGPAGSADSSDQVRQKFFGGTACPGSDASDVMVKVGPLCVDKYEASVWSGPTGGTQYGVTTNDYPCSRTANDCTGATAIHARSMAGVRPSRQASWFQAAVACLNAGKRLLTSAEWQMAAAGTPDPGSAGDGVTTCNTNTADTVATGSTGNCVSATGVADMVGNLSEWVADWVPQFVCGSWPAGFGSDIACFQSQTSIPEARPLPPVRGGDFNDAAGAGVFAVVQRTEPGGGTNDVGFRCAR